MTGGSALKEASDALIQAALECIPLTRDSALLGEPGEIALYLVQKRLDDAAIAYKAALEAAKPRG